MPRKKLTELEVARLKAAAGCRTYVMWDLELPGFGCRVSPKGRKSYVAMYRVPAEPKPKVVMETFGTADRLKLEEARKLARASMRKAGAGMDPREEKRAQQAPGRNTFGDVVERYLEEYASVHQKETTQRETKRLLGRASKVFGSKPIATIQRDDVISMLNGINAKRLKGTGGKPSAETTAVLLRCNKLFRWAEEEELITASPVEKIRKTRYRKAQARDRVLSDEEIKVVWAAFETLGWPFREIGRLILLTGQRPGEVSGLSWPEIDMGKALWTLPKARAKNGKAHEIPLSAPVLSILQGLDRFDATKLLFPDRSYQKATTSFDKARAKLNALLPDMEPWTWHDLRRTCSTGMAKRCRVRPDIIDRVQNHTLAGVAKHYIWDDYFQDCKEALDKRGAHIESLVSVTPETTVITLDHAAE